MTSILEQVQKQLGPDTIQQLSGSLGADPQATSKAISMASPELRSCRTKRRPCWRAVRPIRLPPNEMVWPAHSFRKSGWRQRPPGRKRKLHRNVVERTEARLRDAV